MVLKRSSTGCWLSSAIGVVDLWELVEATTALQTSDVSSPPNYANDDGLVLIGDVIDRVNTMKHDPHAGVQLFAPGAGSRPVRHLIEALLDVRHKPSGYCLGRLFGEVGPDLDKVVLGRLSQPELERSANSFLPRATIRSASKS